MTFLRQQVDRRPTRASILVVVALLAPASALADSTPRPLPANSIGWDVELTSAAPAASPPQPETVPEDPNLPPMVERIGVPWNVVEEPKGIYRWEALDAFVQAAEESGREVILNIYGSHPLYLPSGAAPSPSDAEAVEAWSACLRAMAVRYGTRVRLFQVGRFPDRGAAKPASEAGRDYAYLFKKSAVAIRSAQPSALVALATISSSSIEFAGTVLDEDVAPYSDALAASFDGSEKGREELKTLSGILLAHDPGAKLWITGARLLLGTEGYGALLRAYLAGLEREAALVTFDDPADAQGRPFHIATMDRARRTFTPAFAPLVESGRGVRALAQNGAPLPGATAVRFFDPGTKIVLMAYDGGGSSHRGDFGVFVVDTTDIAEPVLNDLASGESSSAVTMQKDPNEGVSRLALPFADYPVVLAYRRFTTPEYSATGENVAVTGERLPSAEEIIAKMQGAQAAQDALLKNVRSDAREEWHFTIGATTSVDVAFNESFFLDPNVGGEWEQKEIFINGVRWKLKTIPELPFVSVEKVVSLPLRITLSKDYTYEYGGRETVNGRDCHVISFDPVDKTRNLASGRVWVDTLTFARVRLAMVQSNLPSPVISNDQRDTYAPVSGPDGFTYWVLARIDAHQIYSIAGANFVLNKTVSLSDFKINDAGFAAARQEAMASPNQFLRDTDKGLRYTERTEDGDRVVKEGVSHKNLFILGGALHNCSLKYPVPLAGINYFDSDLFGRGLQANVLYAGVLLFANLSNPAFLGTKMDASLDLVGLGFSFKDRQFRQSQKSGRVVEREEEAITRKTESLTGGFGFPFWKFFKIKAEGEVAYDIFARADTKCAAFITPESTTITTGSLTEEFHSKAWGVTLSQSWSDRQSFSRWGLDNSSDPSCPAPGITAQHPDFFPAARNFATYGGAVTKEFYLPYSQKIHVEVSAVASRDLDRFSKYSFGLFENRLRGFSGSGVRFTDGTVGHLAYNFNLADIVRFEADLDQAHVRDRQLGEDFRDYTGVGVAGQFIGPWGMIIQLDVGYALASTVPQFRGDTEFRLEVLKLFSQH